MVLNEWSHHMLLLLLFFYLVISFRSNKHSLTHYLILFTCNSGVTHTSHFGILNFFFHFSLWEIFSILLIHFKSNSFTFILLIYQIIYRFSIRIIIILLILQPIRNTLFSYCKSVLTY